MGYGTKRLTVEALGLQLETAMGYCLGQLQHQFMSALFVEQSFVMRGRDQNCCQHLERKHCMT